MSSGGRTVLLAAWFILSLAGFAGLSIYELTPGKGSAVQAHLPSTSTRYLATVFVHPLCPCSEATLAELASLLTSCPELSAELYFVKHESLDYQLQESRLWKLASAFPRTKLIVDDSGHRAKALGAATSGQTFISDASGGMVFAGGITGARGHIGANIGSSRVERAVKGNLVKQESTPVFGCPIFN